MYFSYCEECKTKECTYNCVEIMMDILAGENYEFAGCPDKEDPKKVQELLLKLNPNRTQYIDSDGKHCTADIRMMNDINDEIYLEIKRIPFAFESSKEIGFSKAYERIMFLVSEILDEFPQVKDCVERIRNDYEIKIVKGYISEFEKSTLYSQYSSTPEKLKSEIKEFIEAFIKYIKHNINSLGKFSFERKKIEIEFTPKCSARKTEAVTRERDVLDASNDNVLDKLTLQYIIFEQRGFCFIIPANADNGMTASEYKDLITNPKDILNQLMENFEKAKNSFYGISSGRYIIQEIFFKFNNDTLYQFEEKELTPIGEEFLKNIEDVIEINVNKLSLYKDFFDKSYLFVTLGDNTYRFEIF